MVTAPSRSFPSRQTGRGYPPKVGGPGDRARITCLRPSGLGGDRSAGRGPSSSRQRRCGAFLTFRGSLRAEARIRGEYRLVGRGLLRGDTYRLRLEREGERITALCRAEGTEWLTCGQVNFPAPDPLWVGIASLQGMVAHFDFVRVLTKP